MFEYPGVSVSDSAEKTNAKSQLVEVTPRLARDLLATNRDNRALREHHVAMLTGAIRRGEWRLTGSGIQLDENGDLIDGQHRLAAVVRANQTVPMFIVSGLDRDVQSVLDTGAKRTAGDYLRLNGEVYSTELASSLRLLHAYETNTFSNIAGRLTNDQILELLEANPGIRYSVQRASRLHDVYRVIRVLTVAHHVIARYGPKSREGIDEFYDHLASGSGLEADAPALRLRDWMIRESVKNGQRETRRASVSLALSTMFKAWNLHVAGRPVKTLRVSSNESRPVPVSLDPTLMQ